MAVRVVENEELIGFEQQYGWFSKKCIHCSVKTQERIWHKFPWSTINREVGYWIKETAHFSCHLTKCTHAFCKKWAPEFEEIKMQRMHAQFGGSANTIAGKSEVI